MAEQKSDKQVIFLTGKSRGAEVGARRTVDSATAERLVRDGLARLPESKKG